MGVHTRLARKIALLQPGLVHYAPCAQHARVCLWTPTNQTVKMMEWTQTCDCQYNMSEYTKFHRIVHIVFVCWCACLCAHMINDKFSKHRRASGKWVATIVIEKIVHEKRIFSMEKLKKIQESLYL